MAVFAAGAGCSCAAAENASNAEERKTAEVRVLKEMVLLAGDIRITQSQSHSLGQGVPCSSGISVKNQEDSPQGGVADHGPDPLNSRFLKKYSKK